MSELPRVQRIVLPILRAGLADQTLPVKVGSWVEDIDYRDFPILNIRRVGGIRNRRVPKRMSAPVIELSAYGTQGYPETEQLYEDALEVLYDAQQNQTMTDFGYIHSVRETMGATQFSSLFQDSWRVQGLIALGIRPPRTP